MLTIGEFSGICRVSTKTLRYYAEIGLIRPQQINPENGYRYYSISQLKTMLFINRLKAYDFTLEEIKAILLTKEMADERLYEALVAKRQLIEQRLQDYHRIMNQLENDLTQLRQGQSVMAYLDDIDVECSTVLPQQLLSIRLMVTESDFEQAYKTSFGSLFRQIADRHLTTAGAPLVLFHSAEFCPEGLDTEFAVPVTEAVGGTRVTAPGLCLRTVLHGPYNQLPSVYTRQREWAEQNGYVNTGALFEVYVTDPGQVQSASELVTEVYYPVRKKD